jgi:hypothetical protein
MPIAVTISSNGGTFQGGSYIVGPLTISSTFTSVQINSLTFGSGTFITTSSPAGSYGVVIEPPSSNLIQLTLKGITGDTGIPIASNQPTVVSFFNPTNANAVGLTSAAQITGVVTLTFF